MKKLFSFVLCLSLLLVTCCSCKNTAILDPENPVTLTMWHNYGGDMQSAMDLLIDKFNSTVGKEEGIVINVTEISSSSELNKSLDMIANRDPGAPSMPDIFTGYPKVAIQFWEKGLLADLNKYFTDEELDLYIDAFLEEGKLSDGGLYVFPIAKSTEVLYVNRTIFDKFAAETGAQVQDLYTFEGIAKLADAYYEWSGGKQFYTADSWFNFSEVGMEQLGDTIFSNETISLDNDNFRYIFNTVFGPAVEGGIAIYDGYSSDLSKTGDIVCSTGSSAGVLFYGDTITYEDGTIENVEYDILPYPIFENGSKTALQRGGGLMVASGDEQKEYAASVFIKWFTAPEQNMDFINKTGYLPVTNQAFEDDMQSHIQSIDDARIKKMLTSVLSMYDTYTFFSAPNYSNLDNDSEQFETSFKTLLTDARSKHLSGTAPNSRDVLSGLNATFKVN